MLSKRRVFSVEEPTWNRGSAWRSGESGVVLTSVRMYRKHPDPQAQVSLSLELGNKTTPKVDRWGEAGSPTDPAPHPLSFLPTSGRLLKSESEDSGVEMASNDHSPSSPVGSEESFSLDGFQPAVEDSPPPVSLEEKGPGVQNPIQDCTYLRSLSVSRKLAQVVQRSQKHRLPGQRPRSLVDLEQMKSFHLPQLASVDGIVDMANGDDREIFGCKTLEEHSIEEQVPDEPSLSMPGQGLRYLEHICQMLEKIAHLQRANMRLQHQQQIMECKIRAQKLENEGFSEEAAEDSELVEPANAAASEMEKEPDGENDSPDSWHPHHFRARSASDTRMLRSPARNHAANKADYSRKSATHSASSPNLLDQLDGGSHTLPANIKVKNDHSNWGKVKVLINRMKRKSLRSNESGSLDQLAPGSSEQCREDTLLDKQEPILRRRFLPALGTKKRRSKHLSIR
ncbi:uncharacterized protein C8orf58 homolog isoform X1 [Anolis carolinensis]|uniref:uncharacterized protein C8orf58 homolog isoform X1 n=1 Tax=Anolis carolinensis TaxID=28377 RepID=UPI002F2B7F1D